MENPKKSSKSNPPQSPIQYPSLLEYLQRYLTSQEYRDLCQRVNQRLKMIPGRHPIQPPPTYSPVSQSPSEPPRQLPVSKREDWVRCLKLGALCNDDGKWVLKATYYTHHQHRVEESRAVCYVANFCATTLRNDPNHHPPEQTCRCGFYAMKNTENAREQFKLELTGNKVLMDVELGGKVIGCVNGYRAEKMRVLKVWVPPANGILLDGVKSGAVRDDLGTEVAWLTGQEKKRLLG